MIILDVECYTNYFLVSFLDTKTRNIVNIDMQNDSDCDRRLVDRILKKYTTMSFNGLGYDLLMLTAFLKGFNNARLKKLSDEIILSNKPSWLVGKNNKLYVSNDYDHVDIMDVAFGQASLKIYGGRLHAPKLQDLPIEPGATINKTDAEQLREYCANDLYTTELLYNALKEQIELRKDMSEQYGVDLRSKSDAQIAETVIKSELEALTGRTIGKVTLSDNYSFKYVNPKIISFKTPELQSVFERILETKFEIGDNGAVLMPEWLKKDRIVIGDAEYQMGIGGLHSCEKRQYIERKDGYVLLEQDVASYYPSIILQQKLAPKSLGQPFLKVYQSLVERRLKAKAEGDKVQADTLKICVNGSFGKLGSKYSPLYSPDLLIQTTVTGQLALLMLIEALHLAGIRTVSANTDGVVLYYHEDQEDIVEEITFNWQLSTSYVLERTDYLKLASRDVNNYVAVKMDKSYKGKGVFASAGLSKNPDCTIVYEAVAAQIAEGKSYKATIKQCRDVTKFVTIRQVKGGAMWRDEPVGKAVRFYYSLDVPEDECITYAKNGNRVPKSGGAKPMMDLPDTFPTDIDYAVYITAAEKLLAEIGHA